MLQRYNVLPDNQDVKSGHFENWYQGVKIISGEYLNGIKHGLWKSQNIEGTVFFQGNYSNDKKNGVWKYYLDQKRLCTIYFRDDKADSTWQSFYPNGNTRCILNYANGRLSGSYKLFYDNGKIKNERTHKDDNVDGKNVSYHSNGTVLSSIEYNNGEPYNAISMSDSSGKSLDFKTLKDKTSTLIHYTRNSMKRELANYQNGLRDGLSQHFYKDGKTYSDENYSAGMKEGVSTKYFSNGEVFYSEVYMNNSMINGSYVETKDFSKVRAVEKSIDSLNEEEDQNMPQSLGGEKGMMAFIQANIIYPEKAKKFSTQGIVYLTFVIERTGTIRDVKVLKGVTDELDAEALRVLQKMPAWIPGFQNGFPFTVQFNLPIKFTLR